MEIQTIQTVQQNVGDHHSIFEWFQMIVVPIVLALIAAYTARVKYTVNEINRKKRLYDDAPEEGDETVTKYVLKKIKKK